jgi:hypothetical protein
MLSFAVTNLSSFPLTINEVGYMKRIKLIR